MAKDFQKWHTLKAGIDRQDKTQLFRAQEIWWCSLGANVGVETDGKDDLFQRPVLVFRKFNQDMFWGFPITSKPKKHKPFYFLFSLNGLEQIAVLSQMRVLSSKRLIRRVGKLGNAEFRELNGAFLKFIQKTDPLRGPRVPNGNNTHYATPDL